MNVRAYWAHWRITVREEGRYFLSDGLWAGLLGAFFAMLLVLFYRATGKTLFFGTFGWGAMAWYLIAAQLLVASKSMLVGEISEQVLNGSIASRMSKPYSLPFALLAEHIGTVIVGTFAALLFMVPLGLMIAGTSALSTASVLVFFVALILGAIIDFALCVAIGLLAFWVEDAKPYYWIYSKILFLLGGLFFPLILFPGWLQTIAKVLPPAFMVYYPARLLVDFNWTLAVEVIAGQLLWCFAALGITVLVYRKAVRMVATNGG